MKILIVNPSFWINGGAEQLIVNLANYLTDNGHQATILTTEMCDQVREQLKETRLLFSENFQQMYEDFQQICTDFDLVNIHNTPCEVLVSPRKVNAVWMCNEPCPQIVMGEGIDEQDKIRVKNYMDKIIVSDQLNKDRIKEHYDIDAEIINYGFDHSFFDIPLQEDVDKFTEEQDIEDGDFIITQVGFIAETKNQLRTLEIFKEIKKAKPNAKLFLCGHDKLPYVEQVRKYVVENGLMDSVILTGELSRDKIKCLYKVSDYVLMPTLTQGSWLSCMESMAAGCNLIVSPEMAASKFLKENKLGYVMKDNQDAVNYVLEGKKQDNPKEKLKEYSWERFSEQMVKKFEEVIQ